MWNVIVLSLLMLGATEVDVRTLDGQGVQGKLVKLDAKQAVVKTAEGERSMAVSTLMSLQPADVAASAQPLPVVIRLVDGSICRAKEFTVNGNRADLVRPFAPLRLAGDTIRSVRLSAADGAVLKQWNHLLGERADSDRLVVRKDESLNYHRGIVRRVSDDLVEFDLDGEVLRVKRSKVFGVIYYRPSKGKLPEPVATLTDSTGSRWSIHTLSLEAGHLRVATPTGLSFDCTMAQTAKIDFSEGGIIYLGKLRHRLVEWIPYFGLKKELSMRQAFFAPRFTPTSDGTPLILGGKPYSQGVTLCSRTELEFDLPEGYRRFKAIAGIDDAFRPHGDVRLVIRGDGRTLLDKGLTGTQPPDSIDVDVTGVRRLRILVDFARGMDLGDHVDLCEARIVK